MNTEKSIKKSGSLSASSSPEMRAKRLKRVRNLANLSREQMCEEGNINRYTLIGWENGRFAGLTTSGAEKVVAKIKKEGVHCTVEWLMEGEGPEPSVNPIPQMPENELLNLSEEVAIAYELAFFKAKNLNAVDLAVEDDGMAPKYSVGDVVAGKKKMGKDIQLAVGRDCIVETTEGERLLRNVRKGKHPQTYTLICSNASIKNKDFVMPDVKLIYAAPVVWHRTKDVS
ncbi:helix-turn-helix transcriptional regulator [Candidatus Dependentiae bacterium]|nr:helix-turn-helix transcriptional regulator [Candidatus Dependentiae bacterium]